MQRSHGMRRQAARLLLVTALLAAAATAHAAGAEQCPQPPWWYSSDPNSSCPAAYEHDSAAAGCASPSSPLAASGASSSRRTSDNSNSSSSSAPAAQRPAAVQRSVAGSSSSSAQPVGVYIARFDSYRMLPELKAVVTQALAGVQGWSWVERANQAVEHHPSDFALLALDEAQLGQVGQRLAAALPSFRDLHPDRRIRGSANWVPEGPLAAAFSDAPQQVDAAGAALRQPPSALRLAQEPSSSAAAAMPSRVLLADGDQAGSSKQQGAPVPGPAQQQPEQQQQVQPPAPVPVPAPDAAAAAREDDAPPEDSIWHVSKPPGRMSTKHTIGLDPASKADRDAGYNKDELRRRRQRRRGLLAWAADWATGALWPQQEGAGSQRPPGRRRLAADGDTRVTTLLEAPKLWKEGFSGKGIKVGVFDTGIREGHPHIRNIKERTNWTHQNSLADGLGHGSFVAGVIGSQDTTCPGFAPDMELYTFKVFTDDQVSYTSWFMDAFNYAVACRLHVINLSIGGPDFLDAPFVDKVLEVTSNGLIMISAIGNDGPLYGTLNNPADQPDVIGVGGIDNDGGIAGFSSRGMTTWELPAGTGRIKPDVMAYGKDVSGSKITTGCRSLSGTSVASPVVAGAATLLASTLPEERRWLLNPASMKQALVEGAVRLPGLNMYEQGAGRINLPASQGVLAAYSPRASLIPPAIDLTDCPYMWPYCTQPLYAFGLPVALNTTIVNGMAVTGRLVDPPVFTPSDEGGRLLGVRFAFSEVLWPWSGYLAVYVEVSPAAWNYTGLANGEITFHVQSPPQYGTKSVQISVVKVPLRAKIVPTPPREKRVLWDVLHSIKYPPGYVPRDNLDIKSDVLDWHGDHPFTNFHDALNALRGGGFFVEVLHSPGTCFDPRNYGAYLAMDSEEEWYSEEVAALAAGVKEHGMALVVFAEWYHLESLKQMKFFDDNTRSWWSPITGGANVPALNELLAPHNISLGERILQGVVSLGDHKVTVSYGSNIATFPSGGYLHVSSINDASGKGTATPGDWAAFGIAPSGKGRVAVLGDTNCLDSSHMVSPCFDFLKDLLTAVTAPAGASSSSKLMGADKVLSAPYTAPGYTAPAQRRDDVNFTRYSWVLSHPLACGLSAACQFRTPASDCPASDKAWAQFKALEPGKEPPPQLLQDVLHAKEAAAAAAAAAAVAAEEEQERSRQQAAEAARTVQDQQPAPAAQQPWQPPITASWVSGGDPLAQFDGGSRPQDSASGLEEAVQQSQRKAFIGQAASWATIICIAGVLGVVVMWQMRGGPVAAVAGGLTRKWAPRVMDSRRYELVPQRRPPSPSPAAGERIV